MGDSVEGPLGTAPREGGALWADSRGPTAPQRGRLASSTGGVSCARAAFDRLRVDMYTNMRSPTGVVEIKNWASGRQGGARAAKDGAGLLIQSRSIEQKIVLTPFRSQADMGSDAHLVISIIRLMTKCTSDPMSFPSPFPYGSFIRYSLPVLTALFPDPFCPFLYFFLFVATVQDLASRQRLLASSRHRCWLWYPAYQAPVGPSAFSGIRPQSPLFW